MSDQAETIKVENMDHFVRILFAWHEAKVKELEHMLQVPEGVEVTLNDGPNQVLEGDLHKGFIIGLSLGLMALGTLPFAAELDEEESPTTDEPVRH